MQKYILLSLLVCYASTQANYDLDVTAVQSSRVNNYCPLGSFWNTQTCIPCSQIQNGYCNCTVYDTCTSSACDVGYFNYGNSTNPDCQPCSPDLSCTACIIDTNTSAVACLNCSSGYQNIGGLCVELNYCNNYNSSTAICSNCTEGTYFNWNFASSNSYEQCSYCDEGCEACSGPGQCNECEVGYTFYYDSYYTYCTSCPSGCQNCYNNGLNCSACYSGYWLNNTDGNCQSCASSINNCLTCTNSTFCNVCQVGYVWNNTIGQCQVWGCGDYCTSCSGTTCLSCDSGYFLNSTANVCYLAQPNCLIQGTYNNISQCNTCDDTFAYTGTTAPQCQPCSSNTVVVGSSDSVRCTYSSSAKAYVPTQCVQGEYLYDSTCVYGQASPMCYTIGSSDYSNCTACYPGYAFNSVNFTCVDTTGCLAYTLNTDYYQGFNCTQCENGYYLDTYVYGQYCEFCYYSISGCVSCSNSSFCTQCTEGYTLNVSAGTCQQCQISYCSTCAADGTGCSQCNSGYTFNNYTNSCISCQSGCSACTNYGLTCQTCSSGYVLQNGACVSLYNANCFISNQNGCTVCNYGYQLVGQYCVECVNPFNAYVCRAVPVIYPNNSNNSNNSNDTPTPTPTPNIYGTMFNALTIIVLLITLLI